MPEDLGELGLNVELIQRSWNRYTSATPELWTPQNPARGQCAVTALVAQDIVGGDLVRTTVNGESHYANRLDDGAIFDLTFQQFPEGSEPDGPFEVRSREYVVSYPDTYRRYQLLLMRITNNNFFDYFMSST